jgi:ribosomal protein S27AE
MDDDARFCPHCGASQTPPTSPRSEPQIIHVNLGSSTSEIAGFIALVLIIGGFVLFGGLVQAFDCPVCHNSILIRWACSFCGYDGKVTLFQLIGYSLSGRG